MDVSTPLSAEESRSAPETAASPPAAGHAYRIARRERILALALLGIDVILRRWYGVREFTSDPSCLLRLARARAAHPVTLSDGTRIAEGEEVLMLHIWNEQVPRFRLLGGPDLGWAVDVRHRLHRSFRQLARYLADDRESAHIRGIHACVTFGSRRRRWQIRRAAERFGFELIEFSAPPKGLHERGEDVLMWLFARAFNPAALRRQPFWRDRTELWISREELIRRYL